LWRAWPRARPPDRASGTVGRKWGVRPTRLTRLALAQRVSLQQRPPASPEETKQPQRTGRRSPANRVAAEELQVHCRVQGSIGLHMRAPWPRRSILPSMQYLTCVLPCCQWFDSDNFFGMIDSGKTGFRESEGVARIKPLLLPRVQGGGRRRRRRRARRRGGRWRRQ
jgi:hypothetical protein